MINRLVSKIKIQKTLKHIKHIGNKVHIDSSVSISCPENITISDFVHIQPNCYLFGGGGIEIGEGTIFAHDVQVLTQNHNYDSDDLEYLPYDKRYIDRSVVIGNFVWVGARVTILPGVHIGDGAVIGAGSVVVHNVPEYAVVAGNPAKVVKFRNKEKYLALVAEDKGYIKNCK